ncbi:hypothetical protein Acr_00g0037900 [Actinidia rufa]|uniref:Uncharacterized protein n=1 Tax=Actinidia rufa TaxID=165716 RepID=A0A7J0DH62_9ERIC|nr:hypothetical protein Acr_00g0037900 [Actinidia rufa]
MGRTVTVDVISAPSLETPQEFVLVNTELGLRWMDPIVNFIRHDKLLEDKREAHKIWITLGGKIVGSLSSHSGILVVLHAEGRLSVCSKMHQVLALFSPDSTTSKGLDPFHQSMALCPVGDGHPGVFPELHDLDKHQPGPCELRDNSNSAESCIGARCEYYQRRVQPELRPSLHPRCRYSAILEQEQPWKLRQGATDGGALEGYQGIKGWLHTTVPSNSPHARTETSTVDHELLATP